VRRISHTLFHKEWHTPLKKVEALVHSMNPTELVVWSVSFVIFCMSAFLLLGSVRDALSVTVPAHGGTLVEGIVGTPRFANPLFAVSDADKDLSQLVYSGLMHAMADGTLVPDMADSYTISDDGLSYSFHIRKGLVWSDGKPVTTDDVEFTIIKAQDVTLKSPRRASWDGVTVEKKDPENITLHLKQPYGLFLESTTMGIMPKHIWSTLSSDEFPFSEKNIQPIGTGPFKVYSVTRGPSGAPAEYILNANKTYALGRPYLDSIILKFYQNETTLSDALNSGAIESTSGISTTLAQTLEKNDARIEHATLTRTFGIFLNQNQAQVFSDKVVRQVLSETVSRKDIIDQALSGFGKPVFSPVETSKSDHSTYEISPDSASTTLKKAGFTIGDDGILIKKTKKESTKLSFSIAAPNVPELVETARILEERWKSLGVGVEVKIFDSTDLQQNIIRTRKYDALLFGMVTGKNPDYYAFWHSSQRNDPGLNVAMYTNPKTDKILESLRKTSDPAERDKGYADFAKEITNDTPAVFLYSPEFLYVIPKDLGGTTFKEITVPSDRFANVFKWYKKTDKIWSPFANENNN
jgi:peptide/nickel transport system substrate-binding protein